MRNCNSWAENSAFKTVDSCVDRDATGNGNQETLSCKS